MTLALEIFSIVFPVFLLIGMGYAFRRGGLINAAFIECANKLVFNVSLPLLLVYKIGQADFSANFNMRLITGSALAILLGFIFSFFFSIWRGLESSQRGAFTQGAFRGNFAIVGLAVVFNAYGAEGLTRAGILLGFLVPLLNLLSVLALLLPHHETGNKGYRLLARSIVLNPLIIGSLIGISWSLTQMPFPRVLDRTLDIISGMTLPLALIAIGGGFSFEKLRGDLTNAVLAVGSKNIAIPALTVACLVALGVGGEDLAIGVLLVSSPTAAGSYVMASQMKGDTDLAGSIIVLSTLFSILTYPLVLLVLKVWFL